MGGIAIFIMGLGLGTIFGFLIAALMVASEDWSERRHD